MLVIICVFACGIIAWGIVQHTKECVRFRTAIETTLDALLKTVGEQRTEIRQLKNILDTLVTGQLK
jgi:hypothetical protein